MKRASVRAHVGVKDLKETETWPVPKSWRIKALGEVAISIDYGTSVKCTGSEIGFPVLRIPNVAGGHINLSDLKFGQPKRSELDQVRLQDGDLLFVRTNGVLRNAGRCALYRGELENCYFASYLIRVRVDSSKVLPAFLNEYARTERGRSYLSGRAIRTADGKFNINSGTLKRVLLPLPPLAEQGKIAGVLGLAQRAIEQQEQLIALTTELKSALLHQLFTQGLRGEPQKQTEIGPVPQSWEVVSIGSLGKLVTGSTPKTKVPEYYAPREVDFIAPADLGQTRLVYDSEKKISRVGLETIRRLPKNAVMCVCIGSSIGKVGMTAKENSATNQQITSIVCGERHESAFVYYLLSYLCDYWRGFATFGPVPILSKGSFEVIRIAVPPTKEEQIEISRSLCALDSKAELHMSKHAALTALFRTLLHQLMTAQIRVHNLDLPELETATQG